MIDGRPAGNGRAVGDGADVGSTCQVLADVLKNTTKNKRISDRELKENMHLFIKLGFNVTFNTLYRSWLVFCGRRKPVHTVGVARFLYCKTADQRQATTSFPHLRSGWDLNSDLRGGRRECYYSATVTA